MSDVHYEHCDGHYWHTFNKFDVVEKVPAGQEAWQTPEYKYRSVTQVRQNVVFLQVGQSEVHNWHVLVVISLYEPWGHSA